MKTDVQSYIHLHESDILADLTNLVAIPSVSCQPSHRADMLRCAELWQQLLLKAGADHAEVMPTEGNPVVFC
jgi:acetylornithine deacetylase/succinyl-diaminopimelate desuccinylase-like protein